MHDRAALRSRSCVFIKRTACNCSHSELYRHTHSSDQYCDQHQHQHAYPNRNYDSHRNSSSHKDSYCDTESDGDC